MTCDHFRGTVVAMETPQDALGERRGLAGHAGSCPGCRAWYGQFLAGLDAWSQEDAPRGFVSDVLARTAGSPCERVRALLASVPDDRMTADDGALVHGHTSRCAACAAFDRSLRATLAALPQLAELDPGPAFAPSVLARTSRRHVSATRLDRLRAAWTRVVQRPRFAWEAAYACTLCWLLVFGQPMAAFDWTTARVSAVAQAAGTVGRRSGQIPDVRKSVPTLPVLGRAAGRMLEGRTTVQAVAQGAWQRAGRWTLDQLSRGVDALANEWHLLVTWFVELLSPPAPPSPPAGSAERTEPPARSAR